MQYFYVVTKSGKSYGSFDTLELAQAFAVQMPISTTIWQGNNQVAEINY